ncbi:thymidine kinase [Jatrophihabitans endophyticus]|uniref:thymidine kinase n=1 Tax=Jatrophihabitans endophyticus TaxID=1206085 RepID=UPI00190EBCE0|nr:thymidine kinase [Jatrophihabitans endophyticus]
MLEPVPVIREARDPREDRGALSSVPAAGNRRATPMPAQLKFFHGPMDCGKSTLALQIDHNHARQGRHGMLLVRYDRSGGAAITTRVGLARAAIELGDDTDIRLLVREHWAAGRAVDYLIVDEAGFLTAAHVDQLAELADDSHVDVYCFGLATDFRTELLPGAKRLFELADETVPVHVEVLCWCGRPGRLNARVVDGRVVREGDTVVVADTLAADHGTAGGTGAGGGDDAASATGVEPEVHYQVLCRTHHRRGDLGTAAGRGQLALELP